MRRLGLSAALLVASPAFAGGVLELVPDNPGPYVGGESIVVNVRLFNPDPVAHDLRVVQLSTSAMPSTMYAGGYFTDVDGFDANHIARYEWAAWSPVGLGIPTAESYWTV